MGSNNIKDLTKLPIGVFLYNNDEIFNTLQKNVGNFTIDNNDNSQVGNLIDPYKNIDTIPFFKKSSLKNNSEDYISYVNKAKLGSNLTLNTESFPLYKNDIDNDNIEDVRISSIETLIEPLKLSDISFKDNDTLLGNVSQYYLALNIENGYNSNSKSKRLDKGISSDISYNFGINKNSTSNGNIFDNFVIDEEDGRYHSTFHAFSSPIYNKTNPNIGIENGKWGNDYNMFNLTSKKTKSYLFGSIYGLDLDNELGPDITDNINNLDVSFSLENIMGKRHSKFNMFNTYFDTMSKLGNTIAYENDSNGNILRYSLNDLGNNIGGFGIINEYAEAQKQRSDTNDIDSFHNVNYIEGGTTYRSFNSVDLNGAEDIITKTNRAFANGQYRTMISRFYNNAKSEINGSETNSSFDKWSSIHYGISHGRNLLSKDADTSPSTYNGYDDPYCRVWTYHHQYSKLSDLMRPLRDNGKILTQSDLAGTTDNDGDENGNTNNKYHWNLFSSRDRYDTFDTGRVRLGDYGVTNQSNGTVNIAPIRNGKIDKGKFIDDQSNDVSIKKCMFSIENLAWKGKTGHYDRFKLSKEQTGPLGGRIMWFPPYNLNFSESTNTRWNETELIGRGEPIYTYTNTTRSGNISFTLLIDHPSVLDYWGLNHKADNGDGNSGTLESDEQTLLRFFAGCDVLVPQPFSIASEKKVEVKKVEEKAVNKIGTKVIMFGAFFPNNYSGIDDTPNSNSRHTSINAIEYLLNGVGTQTYINNNSSQKLQDLPIDMTSIIYANDGDTIIGGYETDLNHGVSVTNEYTHQNELYHSSLITLNGKKTYSSEGYPYTNIQQTGKNYILATRHISPNDWRNGTSTEWFYRVDNMWCGQYFDKDKKNYLDKKSFGLNSIKGIDKVKEYFKPNMPADRDTTVVSLADVYYALHSSATILSPQTKGLTSTENINLIRDILKNKDCIKSIRIKGDASPQGYGLNSNAKYYRDSKYGKVIKNYNEKKEGCTANEKLANNRQKTIEMWLRKELPSVSTDKYEVGIWQSDNANGTTDIIADERTKRVSGDVDEFEDKLMRSAVVYIEYTPIDKVENACDTITTGTDGKTTTITPNGNTNNTAIEQLSTLAKENGNLSNISGKTSTSLNLDDDNNVLNRYDMESLFFNSLDEKAPLLRDKINEKVKYFDPAFHSITPEGFNSRLTFLQQCTRAGQTNSANVNGKDTGNANNMAFGRPPVCVLRLGDFYHTKIVITNISINYGGDKPQWDLNPEGIGLQPMYADIKLDFHFLGGSDLAGPISRIQNALSFNYYGNTGVYDNRSEMITYDENGKMINFKGINYEDNKS